MVTQLTTELNNAIAGGNEVVQKLLNDYAAAKTTAQNKYKAALNVESDDVVDQLKVESEY